MTADEANELMKSIEGELVNRGKKGEYIFGDNCVAVNISHDDGTSMFLTNALMLRKDEWIFVFTEHNGQHFFHNEDVVVSVYKRLYKFDDGETSELLEKIVENIKL